MRIRWSHPRGCKMLVTNVSLSRGRDLSSLNVFRARQVQERIYALELAAPVAVTSCNGVTVLQRLLAYPNERLMYFNLWLMYFDELKDVWSVLCKWFQIFIGILPRPFLTFLSFIYRRRPHEACLHSSSRW